MGAVAHIHAQTCSVSDYIFLIVFFSNKCACKRNPTSAHQNIDIVRAYLVELPREHNELNELTIYSFIEFIKYVYNVFAFSLHHLSVGRR